MVRNDTCIKMEYLVNKFDLYVCRLGQKVDWFSIKYYSISLMVFFGFESKNTIVGANCIRYSNHAGRGQAQHLIS